MKVYLLKESDFEKLQMLIEKIEANDHCDTNIDALAKAKREYRYHLFSWIAEMKEPKS